MQKKGTTTGFPRQTWCYSPNCAGQSGKCSLSLYLETSKKDIDVHQFKRSRAVSDYQKSLVQSKLLCYMNDLKDKSVKPMLYPNISFEFGMPQIAQVVDNCFN